MSNRQSEIGKRQSFAWHGWRLEVPREWNPVRIEGGWDSGFVLFADLHRPQLGLRWSRVNEQRLEPHDLCRRAMRDEVGALAAEESKPLALPGRDWSACLLYVEPSPPGRDVWIAHSPKSGRIVELIHHVNNPANALESAIVPNLKDLAPAGPMHWAAFDLRCTVPPGMRLKSHHFSAGDLTLLFKQANQMLSVREIAVAKLALSRMPLEKWLAREQPSLHYRPGGPVVESNHRCTDGRQLIGIIQPMARRRRFFFMRWLPARSVTAAYHDADRDRLVLLRASDEALLEQVAQSVGCDAS